MATIAFTTGKTMSTSSMTVTAVPNRVFNKKVGKLDISKIDNVLLKAKGTFKKRKVEDWGDELMKDKEIKNILMTDRANDVANKDTKFDPKIMGVPGYTLLGEFFYDEEYQRLMDKGNSKRILRKFDLSLFTIVFCTKFKNPKMNLVGGKTVYANTIDGWHHLIDLYLELRAGNIKDWNPEDWADFPVPTQTWTTDDPTLPGRLALMINGEGQEKWGEFEYMRIHSNNYRLYPKKATIQDELAYNQVMACINNGNSVPVSKDHKDAKAKKIGILTHIGAITSSANADITRLQFIMSQNENWWPMEKRSAAMYGFYGNIYDEYVRNSLPLTGKVFDDHMTAYHYIIQQLFGNLDGAMKAIKSSMKKLEVMSGQGWKTPSGDNSLLAMVEIIYMDYLKGSQRISAARGSHVWTNTRKVQLNVVDALMKLPTVGTTYAQNISAL